MKMTAEQVRELSKKLTELLETEDWVINFAEKEGGKVNAHAITGLCTPQMVKKLTDALYWNREFLCEKAKQNHDH